MNAAEQVIANAIADAIDDYATAHATHVTHPYTGECHRMAGDRCDITAAYRHAAKITRGTA